MPATAAGLSLASTRAPCRYSPQRGAGRAGRRCGSSTIVLLAFFGLVRPALKVVLAPPPPRAPGSTLSTIVDDPQRLPALPAPRSGEYLQGARVLAKDNPAAVAGIVRGWVNGEVRGEAVPARG